MQSMRYPHPQLAPCRTDPNDALSIDLFGRNLRKSKHRSDPTCPVYSDPARAVGSGLATWLFNSRCCCRQSHKFDACDDTARVVDVAQAGEFETAAALG